MSLSTFRRYIQEALPGVVSPADVVVWRPEVPPGEEAQVDFGRLGFLRDPLTGKRRMAYAFIMVLTYSRHMFVRVVFSLDSRTWLS